MKVLGVAPPVRELLRLSNSQPRQKKAGKGLRHFLALNVAFLGRRRQWKARRRTAAAAAEGQAAEGRLRHAPELGQCLPTRKVRGGLTGCARRPYRVRAAALPGGRGRRLPNGCRSCCARRLVAIAAAKAAARSPRRRKKDRLPRLRSLLSLHFYYLKGRTKNAVS